MAGLVVVAQDGGTELDDMSGPLRAIPVLLGSLDAVVDVVDRGLMHQPCPRRSVEVLPASAGVPAVAHAAAQRGPRA